MGAFGKVVLLATDGSPEAARASRMAVELSNGMGLALHVAHVAPTEGAYAARGELSVLDLVDPELRKSLRERALEEARKRLDGEVSEIEESGGKVTRAHPTVGRPDEEIVRLAEELGAGVVVVGGRGSGPFRRAELGSVSDSIVRHANCPVLVARGEEASG